MQLVLQIKHFSSQKINGSGAGMKDAATSLRLLRRSNLLSWTSAGFHHRISVPVLQWDENIEMHLASPETTYGRAPCTM